MKTILSINSIAASTPAAGANGVGQLLTRLGNQMKLLCLGALVAGAAASAYASDPHGIYAFVDKVVLEPNDKTPERIQIVGGFALAEGRGDNYADAQRGYMYFKLRSGEEEICRKEWADLKSVAGTGQIVSFGSRYELRGTVRKPDAKPENADTYPKGWGMTKVKMREYKPLDQLQALQGKKADSKTAPAKKSGS
jgi:hypothetical protein